ncbi:MAG: hypothetical protein PVH61_03525 [Candidatus Aminicenantes bacterium]|jgi:radical SAM superfamily enzyme YgiQ (UPF0313 family)
MKCLVIVPTTMHNYSFSAPLAWMFTEHIHQVKGIYGFELTEELVKSCDFFIIELNWFIELAEFGMLVQYIKSNNKNARILFGGLFAALKYREIFRQYDVDYFIKGDNELPIKKFLESVDPRNISNVVGKDFENPLQYVFKAEDFYHLEFNLDWFPSYHRYIETNTIYQLPMIITSKGGCSSMHQGCDYCMGSKHDVLKKMYNRPPLVMNNDILMNLLAKIEKKFERASLMVISDYNYDFAHRHFDIDMNVEIDSRMPVEKVEELLYAFKKCVLHLSVYEEGISGKTIKTNYKEIMELEDRDHKVLFFAYRADAEGLDIPPDHRLYSEDVLPDFAHWDFYTDMDQAQIYSEVFYHKTLEKEKKFSVKNE